VFCGENYEHLPNPTADCLIPQKDGSTVTAPCFNALVAPMCSNNGNVKLPFGSAPYIGMGLLVREGAVTLHCLTVSNSSSSTQQQQHSAAAALSSSSTQQQQQQQALSRCKCEDRAIGWLQGIAALMTLALTSCT
jgi:hypothetical protein